MSEWGIFSPWEAWCVIMSYVSKTFLCLRGAASEGI